MDDYQIPIDTSKLFMLEGQLKGQSNYTVNVEGITITLSKKISHTNPRDIERMSIYLSHKCDCDHTKDYTKNDPIKEGYYFFFQIKGYDKCNKVYTNCWRLDQDLPKTEGSTSKYSHPYYHFQAGGDELFEVSTGDIIFLSAPRLPHPPMDLFLGLHFLLHNYVSTKDYPGVKDLFNKYDYQQIIKRSQQRMWEHYFKSFHPENTHHDYTFTNVFPLYLH